ncbi:MAG: FHA domain-containing protein [Planctomycetaceae bacterium]|nr:FHA domain-containing protein [Planctomycetaceae bacterium]
MQDTPQPDGTNDNVQRLILKSPAFERGRVEFQVGDMPVVLGRGKHSDIRIDDDLLSRRHAELRLNAQGLFEIHDLDSTNLTIVNKHDVTSHVLQDGDQILLGDTEILAQVEMPASELNDQVTRDLTIAPGQDDETIGN